MTNSNGVASKKPFYEVALWKLKGITGAATDRETVQSLAKAYAEGKSVPPHAIEELANAFEAVAQMYYYGSFEPSGAEEDLVALLDKAIKKIRAQKEEQ